MFSQIYGGQRSPIEIPISRNLGLHPEQNHNQCGSGDLCRWVRAASAIQDPFQEVDITQPRENPMRDYPFMPDLVDAQVHQAVRLRP